MANNKQFNLEAFDKYIATSAKIPGQSLYDLYCKISNDKINSYHALRIAYEMGKNRVKYDLEISKDRK